MSLVNMLRRPRDLADHPARRLAAESGLSPSTNCGSTGHVAAYTLYGPAIRRCRPADLPIRADVPDGDGIITSFPFAAMGSVHAGEPDRRHRPISVTDTVDFTVHAENLRGTPRIASSTLVTDIRIGNVRHGIRSPPSLHQQRTTCPANPSPNRPKQPKNAPPNVILRITPGNPALRLSGRRPET